MRRGRARPPFRPELYLPGACSSLANRSAPERPDSQPRRSGRGGRRTQELGCPTNLSRQPPAVPPAPAPPGQAPRSPQVRFQLHPCSPCPGSRVLQYGACWASLARPQFAGQRSGRGHAALVGGALGEESVSEVVRRGVEEHAFGDRQADGPGFGVLRPGPLSHSDLLTRAVAAGSVPSPSGSVPGAAAPFRPLFNDFGPPSMGYVQVSVAKGLLLDEDRRSPRCLRSLLFLFFFFPF